MSRASTARWRRRTPLRSTRLRLDMTSAAPGTGGGFLMIAELQARSNGAEI